MKYDNYVLHDSLPKNVTMQSRNLKQFTNWLFPYKCISCGTEVDELSAICHTCFTKITFIDHPICKVCGRMFETQESYEPEEVCERCSKQVPYFDAVRSLLQYDAAARRIIMQIKKNTDYNVVAVCAKMLYSKYQSLFEGVDYITPVPSHRTRLLMRGNNPPDVIALKLAAASGVEYKKIIKRIRKTEYQKDKSAEERRKNVAGAFACYDGRGLPSKPSEGVHEHSSTGSTKQETDCGGLAGSPVVGKNVVVVDDVMTTGATMNECAKVLKAAGAKTVIGITIASTNLSRRGRRAELLK
ncbi:MAG: double zinc ribbon domain-containing protein [Holosporales bacterium]|jgi:predicted amidophosphoribosyltransferase|nr:double zinc ribbon domain-containing protein [Holosporales bacterium]